MSSLFSIVRQHLFEKLEKPRKVYAKRIYNNLEKLYSVILPGDVVLVEGRSEMSRLIRLFTGSVWSHSAIYVGEKLVAPDSKSRDQYRNQYGDDANHMLVEAFSGKGVVYSPLSKYQDYNIRICRPYGIVDSDLENVIDQITERVGQHYDNQNVLEMALMLLQTIWKSKRKYALNACLGNCNDYEVICSGMIAQAFQSVGYPIVPEIVVDSRKNGFERDNPYGGGLLMRHYTQITPKDFDLSPNFEIIKYNIIGATRFDYKTLWIDRL